MMINSRLIGTVRESKKYIAANVLLQWVSLVANIAMIMAVCKFLSGLYGRTAGIHGGSGSTYNIIVTAAVIVAAVIVRYACTIGASCMSYKSSETVKKTLRERIYRKLLNLGASYNEQIKTSEVVQVAVEGVDQLETYFGAYLPQFFYAMLAPVTLFIVMSFINVLSAVVLLVCVPLIPVSIAVVQTWAKKLLSRYWNQYTELGDTFLENLSGLTTLKIYQAEEYKNEQMNQESEKFRKITMKVLTMQLNSITIMDLIAYGGAAAGMIMALIQFQAGRCSLFGCLAIILLAADYFIPMRQLGSFFHIAMNGMEASDKIFRLLDIPEVKEKAELVPEDFTIRCSDLEFSYEENREILKHINMTFSMKSFTAIVGESGSGKSTIAGIIMGRNRGYSGQVTIGGVELSDINEDSLMENITYIGHQSYLFKGTVRDNLLMGCSGADDAKLWEALERVNLSSFLKNENGLDTMLTERAANLSGGQRQRLALARALLHDSPVYIFDEATSNIDVESENDIMKQIHSLAGTKTVILISHRLANVTDAGCIYVMDDGAVKEVGKHEELLGKNGTYARLWNTQTDLEKYGHLEKDENHEENESIVRV